MHVWLTYQKSFLDRAKQLLNEYETGMIQKGINQVYLSWIQCSLKNQKLLQRLQQLDIDSMTPREALDCLYELKKLSNEID